MHCIYLPDACSCFVFTSTFMHAVTQFHFRNVAMSAESVDGSTPGVRVTWNTTVPPERVVSVAVNFRTSSHTNGPVAANYTTTNTSQKEVIHTCHRIKCNGSICFTIHKKKQHSLNQPTD